MAEELDQSVFRTALSMLSTGGLMTQPDVERAADAAINFVAHERVDAVDREQLVRRLQGALDIYQPDSIALTDDTNHVAWLDGRRGSIDWAFSERYLRYLREHENRPPRVLDRLDRTTMKVLSHLGDPERKQEPWDRRGLVVGAVQSGKTANFVGLICRAADAGYRLIVVLTGMYNNLRSQTQLRVDEGFLGFDTQIRQNLDRAEFGRVPHGVLGVGRLPGVRELPVASLTTSADNGDFRTEKAKSLPVQLGVFPVVLAVKKHVGILENLRGWILEAAGHGDPQQVHGFSLLVLDDEADNASISTRDPYVDNRWAPEQVDPTGVNGAIRKLLNAFQRKAYVGYTATPNANIYIPHDVEHPDYGKDLFPEHFIEYIAPPTNYFGPARVFGTQDSDDDDKPKTDQAPRGLIRIVKDHPSWLPDKHKNGTTPGELPNSLRIALRSFVLARAVRLARGQRQKHNSMLVHVSRFKSVQEAVRDQVRDELEDLRGRIRFGDGDGPDIRAELRDLFETDFVSTTEKWQTAESVEPVEWQQVERELEEAAHPIETRLINGDAVDALEYFEHRWDGLNVIAIGGNKLSRGLTLEELSVSYYLRAASTHDTLLQMGRWFGYRDGYEDVCRLYTTAPLVEAFRGVTEANQELIDEFENMVQQGKKPRDYGLKIQDTVADMLVTARNKMPGAITVRIGFSGQGPSTVVMYCDKPRAEANLAAAENLVNHLDDAPFAGETRDGGTRVWSGVDGLVLADEFFDRYESPASAWRVQGRAIANYIRNRVEDGELTDWTVALLSSTATSATKGAVGEYSVGLTVRAVLAGLEDRLADGFYSIKQLLSPGHEAIDLSKPERDEALELTLAYYRENPGRFKSEPKRPVGRAIRAKRPKKRGLLLLYALQPPTPPDGIEMKYEMTTEPIMGFLASFPNSPDAPAVDYVVNRVYLEEFFGDEDLDEEPS